MEIGDLSGEIPIFIVKQAHPFVSPQPVYSITQTILTQPFDLILIAINCWIERSLLLSVSDLGNLTEKELVESLDLIEGLIVPTEEAEESKNGHQLPFINQFETIILDPWLYQSTWELSV
ncbi:hypothetical protein BY996DRAFT_6463788 [Phakopsora pachyrhizi]|nr:hypothetical protein BY996DRAFT_6463788 [Phakopsora pachyrhizi]